MDKDGSNFGGGGQFSLLGHEQVPSSFGEHGSKSKCSSFRFPPGECVTLLTAIDSDLPLSAEPTAGNFIDDSEFLTCSS